MVPFFFKATNTGKESESNKLFRVLIFVAKTLCKQLYKQGHFILNSFTSNSKRNISLMLASI